MLDVSATIAAAVLSVVFAWAALAKLARWRDWRDALGRYDLSGAAKGIATWGVPLVEATILALLIAGRERVAGALVLAVISAFSLAVLRARAARGDRVPCGCFGRASTRDYRALLVRNALLGALAALLLLADRRAPALALPRGAEALPAGLAAAGLVVAAWMSWQVRSALRRRA